MRVGSRGTSLYKTRSISPSLGDTSGKTENPESHREDMTELVRKSPESSEGKASGNARLTHHRRPGEKLLATHWDCGTDTRSDRTKNIPRRKVNVL